MNIIEAWLSDLQQRLDAETLIVPEVRIGVFYKNLPGARGSGKD